MKKWIFKPLLAITAIAFIATTLSAQVREEKRIDKTWPASQNQLLKISNKFGKIDLKNWDKNEIKMDIEIWVETKSAEKSKEYLDKISISFDEASNLISVATVIEEEKVKFFSSNGDGNKKFEINYTVYHPIYQKMEIDNKFGDVFVNELSGKGIFNIKYGSFTGTNLSFEETKPLSEINVSYGNVKIEKCTWLQLDLKYGNSTINQATALITISKYSNLTYGNLHALVINSKYDNISINSITSISIDNKYGNLKINNLKNQLTMNSAYTDVKIKNIAADFSKLVINNEYGGVDLGIDENACYTISASVDFGEISIPDKADVNRIKSVTKEQISGKVGCKENTNSSINIVAKYSDVSLIK